MPGILDPIPTDSDLWVTEEGSYHGVMITNVPYIATDFLAAPNIFFHHLLRLFQLQRVKDSKILISCFDVFP